MMIKIDTGNTRYAKMVGVPLSSVGLGSSPADLVFFEVAFAIYAATFSLAVEVASSKFTITSRI